MGALIAACGARTGPTAEGPDAGDPLPMSPGNEAMPGADATSPNGAHECADEMRGRIFGVTDNGFLYSFDTSTFHFDRIGPISCATSPFSMAVNRFGTAFVEDLSGSLVEVDTRTAACQPTAYRVGQHGFQAFGMAFASDGGSAERLFVIGDPTQKSPSALATIDTKSFELDVVHAYDPPVARAELSGTSDQKLFAYFAESMQLVELDKSTGAILSKVTVPNVSGADGFAFAWSGGRFFIFTNELGTGRVTRFDPDRGESRLVARLPNPIVGAGVSTCPSR